MASSGYTFSTPASGQQPYAYYYGGGSQPPFDVIVPLDAAFTATPSGRLPAPFVLEAGSSPFPYQLRAPRDSAVWDFSGTDPLRPAVRSAFDQLLDALELLPLKPGRLQAIRNWLAQLLPQTFAETLYLRHGFDPAGRTVDLTPGMRLRVDFEAHQAVDPGQSPLNGFVGSGAATIEVAPLLAAGGQPASGFDPFLSQLQGLLVPPPHGGAAGAIDLQGAAYQLPWWRLVYPRSFSSGDTTGDASARQNVALLGAPTHALLTAATSALQQDRALPAQAVLTWFRGRAAVVPEIPIVLQGVLRHVPLGTTVRGLLSGFGAMPWIADANVTLPSQFFTRMLTTLDSSNQIIWSPIAYANVNIQKVGFQTYGPTCDSLDLPLLGGDALSIPVASSGR